MSFATYLVPLLIVFALVILNVLCGDVSHVRHSAPSWPISSNWNSSLKSTTPWPALGQRRNFHNENFSNNPTWVRPNQRQTPNRSGPNNNFNAGPQFGTSNQQANIPQVSPGEVTDQELREFSEAILSKDINNAAKYVTVNLQSKTTSRSERDEAPLPLLNINKEAFKIPTIEKMLLLHDNYIVESNVHEHYSSQEKVEENNLLDSILSTPIMQYTRNFLIQKGAIGRDPREFKDILREIWFNMYSRGGGRIGSSGFEHVFLAEIKKGQVSGLHNWLYFSEEEQNNQANYLGYMKKIDLGNKGFILQFHFTFHGIDKPVGGMFIGTSPELEMALFSTCFLLRADRICPLTMNGNRFSIRTYRYGGKNLIGSAFPDI